MSNRIQARDHSQNDLDLSVKSLSQQFEELQRLRDRVGRAEAKAVHASRHQGRGQKKGHDYSPRSGEGIH
jgi:hypothetical protein